MRTIRAICLTAVTLACIANGNSANAQASAPPAAPAYYVADFAVTDREGIKPYSAAVESTFRPYGGRFIVHGADAVGLEGQAPTGRLVVIEFDSMAKAQAWYNSPEYAALRPIRQRSGRSNIFLLQGLAAP
jgi:uncharacterized protein (DUF1330 family)